ncbi:hypothetical protein P9112_006459 [Eukaryota sp. TZLM1-RC]
MPPSWPNVDVIVPIESSAGELGMLKIQIKSHKPRSLLSDCAKFQVPGIKSVSLGISRIGVKGIANPASFRISNDCGFVFCVENFKRFRSIFDYLYDFHKGNKAKNVNFVQEEIHIDLITKLQIYERVKDKC